MAEPYRLFGRTESGADALEDNSIAAMTADDFDGVHVVGFNDGGEWKATGRER